MAIKKNPIQTFCWNSHPIFRWYLKERNNNNIVILSNVVLLANLVLILRCAELSPKILKWSLEQLTGDTNFNGTLFAVVLYPSLSNFVTLPWTGSLTSNFDGTDQVIQFKFCPPVICSRDLFKLCELALTSLVKSC